MNKNELVECFKKNICKYCTGNCDKGITFTQDGAKCVDYKKKIQAEGYKKEAKITAKRKKALMKNIY